MHDGIMIRSKYVYAVFIYSRKKQTFPTTTSTSSNDNSSPMLGACLMCDEGFDPVSWPGYKVVCGHCYCHSCFNFFVKRRFPCLIQCREKAIVQEEEGTVIKMTIVPTFEADDQRVVNE